MKRDQSIDFVKGIAMIAITIGHVIGSYSFGNSWLSQWVYSFELPAFFLVSGWLQQKENRKLSSKEYTLKQLKAVIYPYITFSCVYILVFLIIEIIKGGHNVLEVVGINMLYTISLYGIGALWFLPTFFISSIIGFEIWKLCTKYKNKEIISFGGIVILITLGAVLSSLTINLKSWNDAGHSIIQRFAWRNISLISRSIVCASLILIGRVMFISKNYFSRKRELHIIKKWGWINSFILIGIGAFLAMQQHNIVDLHFSFIFNPLLFYSSSICTVLGIMIIGTKVNVRIINHLGRYSLIVMACQLVQQYTCRIVNKLIERFSVDIPEIYVGASICTVIFVLLCSIIAIHIINKYKFAQYLIKFPMRKSANYTSLEGKR